MMRLFLLTATLTLAGLATPAIAQPDNPVVLELFTSRACGDTPPIDRLMHKITEEGRNDNLIVLTCHVPYFNLPEDFVYPVMGPPVYGPQQEFGPIYNDMLAEVFCRDRQVAYLRAAQGSGIFTPQIIINGRDELAEPTEDMVEDALAKHQKQSKIMPIGLAVDSNTLRIELPGIALEEPAELWLFGYKKSETVEGAAGLESENELMTYVNIITQMSGIMEWDGKQMALSFPLDHIQADGYVVLAQNPRKILMNSPEAENSVSMNIAAAGKIERD